LISYLDLAELISAPAPFDRPGWIFELKYDGYRMFASSVDSEPQLLSRRGTDYTERFPEIAVERLRLPDVVLDGELVIVDDECRPQFDRLTRRSRMTKPISIKRGSRTDPACLFVFDILSIAGDDVRARPLADRKALLAATVAGLKRVRYVDHIDQGVTLFKIADQLGLKGIVAKRADAHYPRRKAGRSKPRTVGASTTSARGGTRSNRLV
jgi:bifunctional non-homologous end joining protein LigD